MAQQEDQQNKKSPLSTLSDAYQAARFGQAAWSGISAAIGAVAPWLPGFLAVMGVVIFTVILIVVILVGVGILGSGGGAAHASPGGGLGVNQNYCQTNLSPDDLNGDGTRNDCSIVLEGIILQAASWAKVPAGVLNGIGLSENLGGAMILSESQITQYSAPGAVMPGCAVSVDNAQGPMQFLPSTWDRYKNAVNIATGQSRTPNICNIEDSIYAAAWKIKCDSISSSDAAAVEECTSGHFTKYNYSGSSSAWDKSLVDSVAGSYLGACVDPRYPDVHYCDSVWQFYQRKQDLGVSPGPGGQACYQFDRSWTSDDQASELQAIGFITQSAKFVQLLCSQGGAVVLHKWTARYSEVNPSGFDPGIYLAQSAATSQSTRIFVLAHESTHVIMGRNSGLLQSFENAHVYEDDGGLIKSYPSAALGGADCTVDGDIPITCYNESVAESDAWYVADGTYTSGSGIQVNLQGEYPHQYAWVRDNIFAGYVYPH